MNTDAKKAAARLHQVLADTTGLTNAELRRQLQQEGVDVNAFLQRIRPNAPAGPQAPAASGADQAGIARFLASETVELPLAARQTNARKSNPTA